jgi:hypothetical protein
VLRLDFVKQFEEILACEVPLERLCDRFIVVLEVKEPFFQRSERGEVVRGKGLSLDDREVDFDLIEPAGMDRTMDKNETGVLFLQSLGGGLTPMRGPVIDDPKDSPCLVVGREGHDLCNQSVKRKDPGFLFTAAKEFHAVNIQRRQIGPSPATRVFVLEFPRRTGLRRKRRVATCSGLNAGLFIGREDKLILLQRLALPDFLVKIQDATGFDGKLGITREKPASVTPRSNGIFMQPAPNGCVADARHQAGLAGLTRQLGCAESREGNSQGGGQLTRHGFNFDDHLWGEKLGDDPSEVALPARLDAVQRIACATGSRPRAAYSAARRSHGYSIPEPPAGSFWRARHESTITYICWPFWKALAPPLESIVYCKGFF